VTVDTETWRKAEALGLRKRNFRTRVTRCYELSYQYLFDSDIAAQWLLVHGEAEGRNGDSKDQVPMIIVTTGIKSPGYKSNVAYSHASYLATVENIFGLPKLGAAMTAASMEEFWQ